MIEEAFRIFTRDMSVQYQQFFTSVSSREEACDAIAELIFSAQVTTARNMELMYQLYAFLQQPAGAEGGDAALDAAQSANAGAVV